MKRRHTEVLGKLLTIRGFRALTIAQRKLPAGALAEDDEMFDVDDAASQAELHTFVALTKR